MKNLRLCPESHKNFRHNTDIGQNFLRDRTAAAWMAERACLSENSRVLEIGPGDGVLTKEILKTPCARIDAVELDTRLSEYLEPLSADGRLSLHWGDALRFEYSSLSEPPDCVIANLPYHITTPLLWTLLEQLGKATRYMLLMTQREAAVRIASGAGLRESCPLGVTLAAMSERSVVRHVPRGAFYPVPNVDSSVVEIIFTGEKARMRELARDRAWRRILSGSFALRRKTLVNNWAAAFHMPKDDAVSLLGEIGLGIRARAEELSMENWLALHKSGIAAGMKIRL
ncbi:ribosomal RNA small subunit methyltransferase A [Synergistales bacterium]|nr:ribosomal RNA small subunit methyltransferase A [Synergistales bacterium]